MKRKPSNYQLQKEKEYRLRQIEKIFAEEIELNPDKVEGITKNVSKSENKKVD